MIIKASFIQLLALLFSLFLCKKGFPSGENIIVRSEGIFCESTAIESTFQWNGRIKLNLKLAPSKIATNDFIYDSVREQLNYWRGAYPYLHQTRGIRHLIADRSSLSLKINSISKLSYGSDMTIEHVKNLKINWPKYAEKGIKVSKILAVDPAIEVDYLATARMALCIQNEVSIPTEIDLPLPLDPYLIYWSIPRKDQRSFRNNEVTVQTNPCSTSPLITEMKPELYSRYWNPRRFRFDDHGIFFDCEALLKKQYFEATLISQHNELKKINIGQRKDKSLHALFSRLKWDILTQGKKSATIILNAPSLGENSDKSLEVIAAELMPLAKTIGSLKLELNFKKIRSLGKPAILFLKAIKEIISVIETANFEILKEKNNITVKFDLISKSEAQTERTHVSFVLAGSEQKALEKFNLSLNQEQMTIFVGNTLPKDTLFRSIRNIRYQVVALFVPLQFGELPQNLLLGSTQSGKKITDVISTPSYFNFLDLPVGNIIMSFHYSGKNIEHDDKSFFSRILSTLLMKRSKFLTFDDQFFYRIDRFESD